MENISPIHIHYNCDCKPIDSPVTFYHDHVTLGVKFKCPTCNSKVLVLHCYGYDFAVAEKCQHPGCECDECALCIEIDYFSDMLKKPKPESNLVKFLRKKKALARK